MGGLGVQGVVKGWWQRWSMLLLLISGYFGGKGSSCFLLLDLLRAVHTHAVGRFLTVPFFSHKKPLLGGSK